MLYFLKRSPGAVLNFLASLLNILAEAVSGVAARTCNCDECDDEQEDSKTFNQYDHILYVLGLVAPM